MNWLYECKEITTNYTHLSPYSEEQLLALWFQTVKEEQSTPLEWKDWIDKANEYFCDNCKRDRIPWHSIPRCDDIKTFREAIEKYMPQQFKPLDNLQQISKDIRYSIFLWWVIETDNPKTSVKRNKQKVQEIITKCLSQYWQALTSTDGEKEDYTDKDIEKYLNCESGLTEDGKKLAMNCIKSFLIFTGIHKNSAIKRSQMSFTPNPQESQT
jgi:hypothetical protein